MLAGMKGGSVQNPIHALAQFVDNLHAPNGSVNVEGFYRYAARLTCTEASTMPGPVICPPQTSARAPCQGGDLLYRGVRERTEKDKADAVAFPFDEAAEMASLGAMGPHGEEGFTTLERRWARSVTISATSAKIAGLQQQAAASLLFSVLSSLPLITTAASSIGPDYFYFYRELPVPPLAGGFDPPLMWSGFGAALLERESKQLCPRRPLLRSPAVSCLIRHASCPQLHHALYFPLQWLRHAVQSITAAVLTGCCLL